MNLDFLRDNTNIINGKGAYKREKPFDFTKQYDMGYQSNMNPIQQPTKRKVQAKRIVKLYANNEKEIVDLATKAMLNNPRIVKSISKGLKSGLQALQKELTANGYVVDMIKAYKQSKKANNLLGRLLAFTAKGIIIVDDAQKRNLSASRGATTRIRLISAKETKSPNYKPIGRFSGIYGNQVAISRFRISAINELGQMLGIKSTNAYRVLATRYETDDFFGKNDLNTETTFNLANLTDDELADCIECGAYSKDEVKAMVTPQRAKAISKILQKRFTL